MGDCPGPAFLFGVDYDTAYKLNGYNIILDQNMAASILWTGAYDMITMYRS